jgi:hypothetical protein
MLLSSAQHTNYCLTLTLDESISLAAEADLNDSKLPSSAGAAASRYIFALYQQRLNEEALKLADKYPIRIHYTR